MATLEEKKKEFDELVRKHDLTYQYSDDHQVWVRGTKEKNHIKAKAKDLPDDFVEKTWNKHVDKKIVEGSRKQFYWKN